MKGELIPPSLRGKMPTKSLLYDEFVSLQLAAYLRSQKFNATPKLVKNYLDQHILPQLNIRPVQYISVRTSCRWMHKLGFHFQRLGPCMHISDFLTETVGPLKDSQEEAHIMIILGANRDGFWDSAKLLEQVRQAIDIFERTHPGCVGVFAFNNATSHTAFAENALVASKMNLSSGGSAPKMRDTIWNGNRQSMVIEEDYFVYDKKKKVNVNLQGQPKGRNDNTFIMWE
ncbi:15680_t:CDS:2 [Cetraspora pellucida]|uniref:15680_t:CDS:1 n=1 Tax=Cetraspora pellucida TaxID=1433469 RepID=A0ACA9KR16_9GLOM|nr:15680_t:CDS:2 [Cetraspora pellucida]